MQIFVSLLPDVWVLQCLHTQSLKFMRKHMKIRKGLINKLYMIPPTFIIIWFNADPKSWKEKQENLIIRSLACDGKAQATHPLHVKSKHRQPTPCMCYQGRFIWGQNNRLPANFYTFYTSN